MPQAKWALPALARPTLNVIRTVPKPGLGLLLMGGLFLLDWWLSIPPADAPHQLAGPVDTRPPFLDTSKLPSGVKYRYFVQATDWYGTIHGYNGTSVSEGVASVFEAFGPVTLQRVDLNIQLGRKNVIVSYETGDGFVLAIESAIPEFRRPYYTPGSTRIVRVEIVNTGQVITDNKAPLAPLPFTFAPPGKLNPPPLPPSPPATDKNKDKKETPDDRKFPGPIFGDFPSKPDNDQNSDEDKDTDKNPDKNPNPDGLKPNPEPKDKLDPKSKLGLKPVPTTEPKEPKTTPTGPDPSPPDSPFPLFPPFPIINPQNPTVPKKEEEKSPVYQNTSGKQLLRA